MPRYKFTREELLSREEIRNMIEAADYPWFRALIAFLYIWGPRITEALSMKRKDFWPTNPPGRGSCIAARILTEKKKKPKGPFSRNYRVLEVSKNTVFMSIFLEYLNAIQFREELVFPGDRITVWRRLKKLNPLISPQIFRHSRLMRHALKGASDQQLTEWAGWSDSRPAKNYMQAAGRLGSLLGDLIE